MNDQPETETPMKTLSEFMAWIHQLESGEYLFRGLPCAQYTIIASAYLRLDPEADPEQVLALNKELIKDARLQRHDHRNGRELSDLEVLAELQHFRAATCLIDFTYSPLVALWFACQTPPKGDSDDTKHTSKGNSDGKERTSEDDSDGKVSAVCNDPIRITEITPDLLTRDTEIDHFFQADENERYPLYRWQPSQLNNRIVSQHSVFLFGHDKIIKPDAECIIAADSKEEILESLRAFSHISDLTLFPDFDGFARRRSYNIPYLQLSASEYRERGNRAAQRGEYQLAIRDYSRAIELNPDDAAAHNNRGIAYRNIEEYQAAIRDYSRAIELNPDYVNAYYNRGIAYRNIEEYQAAIRDYSRAIELNPDDAAAHNNRGIAYRNIEEYQAAIKDCTRAIELNPDYVNAYYNRGIAYRNIREYQAAIRDYDKVIELNPDDVEAYNDRGVAYRNTDDFQAAIKDYSRAIELNPDYAQAYCNRGIARSKLGNAREAEADFQTALRLARQAEDETLIARIEQNLRSINSNTGETQ